MHTETLRPAPRLLGHDRSVFGAALPALQGRRRRALARLVMLTCGGLVEVEGAGRLRGLPEPAIFALNHSNSFESVLVPTTLIWLRGGRPLHFLIDWMFLHLPLLGWLLRQCEPIPVYSKPAKGRWREEQRLEQLKAPVLDACLARLATGGSLGIFPEGTRNRDPRRLLRARAGLGELILRTDVPVVPVGIHYPAAERLGRP
ncbi:MAG TPA: lysophospholipid acyltransferase family protein, partial [Thermoanaerobaculia bacterium]|nr:lysophospholipid acyltransferase family protein [Thermoanaerobaculia bacterium]